MSRKEKQMKKDHYFSFRAEEKYKKFQQVDIGLDSLTKSSFNVNLYPHTGSQVFQRSWVEVKTDFKPMKQEDKLQSTIPWDRNQSTSGYNFLNKDKIYQGKRQNGYKQTQRLFRADLQHISIIDFNKTSENRGQQKKQQKQKDRYECYSQSQNSRLSDWSIHYPQDSFKKCEQDSIFIEQLRINSEKSASYINQSRIKQMNVYKQWGQQHTMIENNTYNDKQFQRYMEQIRKKAQIISKEPQLMSEEIQRLKAVSRWENNTQIFSLEGLKYSLKLASILIKEFLDQIDKEKVPQQIKDKSEQAVRCWKMHIKIFKSIADILLNSDNFNSLSTFVYNIMSRVQSIAAREQNSFANLSLNYFSPQVLVKYIKYAAQIENQEFEGFTDQINGIVFKKFVTVMFRRIMRKMIKLSPLDKQDESKQSNNLLVSIFQRMAIEPMLEMFSKYPPNMTHYPTSNKYFGSFYSNLLPNLFSFIKILKPEQDYLDSLQLFQLNNLIDPMIHQDS